MPYLTQELKNYIDQFKKAGESGELNYILTCTIVDYLLLNRLKYVKINDVVGALECCKLEFYRRVAASYEDKKIQINGDVYPKELIQ